MAVINYLPSAVLRPHAHRSRFSCLVSIDRLSIRLFPSRSIIYYLLGYSYPDRNCIYLDFLVPIELISIRVFLSGSNLYLSVFSLHERIYYLLGYSYPDWTYIYQAFLVSIKFISFRIFLSRSYLSIIFFLSRSSIHLLCSSYPHRIYLSFFSCLHQIHIYHHFLVEWRIDIKLIGPISKRVRSTADRTFISWWVDLDLTPVSGLIVKLRQCKRLISSLI